MDGVIDHQSIKSILHELVKLRKHDKYWGTGMILDNI